MSDMEEDPEVPEVPDSAEGAETLEDPGGPTAPHRVIGTPPPTPRLLGPGDGGADLVPAQGSPGGLTLGRMGPVTEGLVIFLGGMGFLVLMAMWITAKRREPWTAEGSGPASAHGPDTPGDAWTEH